MNPPRSTPAAISRRLLLWAVLTVGVAAATAASADEAPPFKVIINPANPTASMSKAHVSALFLKRKREWVEGVEVKPVDLQRDDPTREKFSKSVHGRSASSIVNYWKQQIFSGRGVPPPEVGNDAAVVKHVLSHRGGVGYVSGGTDVGKAKVLSVH